MLIIRKRDAKDTDYNYLFRLVLSFVNTAGDRQHVRLFDTRQKILPKVHVFFLASK
jgi:hypothetical protein